MSAARFYWIFLTMFSFGVNAQTLSDSLKAHYKFDGSLNDETVNNYDLALVIGSISYTSHLPTDSAIVFNGFSSVSTINNFDNTAFTEIAISLWFKANAPTNALQIILQGVSLGFGVYLEPNSGKLYVHFDGNSMGSNTSTFSVTDGNWHHAVVQNNGTTSFMYIDGIFQNSISEILSTGTGGPNEKLYMGISSTGIQPFTGSVNDLRIYNRLLSQCEISKLYSQTGCPSAIYDTTRITVYDTIAIYDTTFITAFDTVAVTDTLIIDVLTGLNPPNSFNTIKVYPNPTTNLIFIDNGNFSLLSNHSLKIVSASGQTIFNSPINVPSFTVDLTQFGPNGLFFLQILDSNNQIVQEKKIVLQ